MYMLQYPVGSQPEDNQSAVMVTWGELRDVRIDVIVTMVDSGQPGCCDD